MLLFLLVTSNIHAKNWVLNDPYSYHEKGGQIFYSSFVEQPKTLDAANSYSSNEYQFTMQIYEPLLQFDYLKRPYQLVPLIATTMPLVRYLNAESKEVSSNSTNIKYSVYKIQIKANVFYQPHPAFAKNNEGQYRYLNLDKDYLDSHDINQLSDFKHSGTRELLADDFIYQIKRLASPKVNSPIYGLMADHITGFRDFATNLPRANYVDLRKYPLVGVRKIDNYQFELTIFNQYPQFLFWLSMPFFAPIPWEVDKFYSQSGMKDKNLSLEWYPVGTGPFMLTENNPNRRMVLTKNPYYRQVFFPSEGSKEDKDLGYLKHAGEALPLIDKAVFMLEKESIPRWNKFLQGYYDSSGVSTDSFDEAIEINRYGDPMLNKNMRAKGVYLNGTTDPSIYYLGFNMLDPIVGGTSTRARKLRQAISIAVNYDEYIAIFYNGRGMPAQGPIPPGIFGYKEGKEGINPYVYNWQNGEMKRKPIFDAKKLLIEAGYPNGIDPKTKKPLILHYDVQITNGPDDKALLEWMRKQFAKIGIDLNVRATEYNRFQDKMRSGNAQIFSWGWQADYPDPENFLFMLYSKNGKVKYGGENAANFANHHYDELFLAMKNRNNDEKRQEIIDKMIALLRSEAPWVWGINSQTLLLSQQWVSATKPNTMSVNTLKYVAIDVEKRNQLRNEWNKPILWPLLFLVLFIAFIFLPLSLAYMRKEKQSVPRIKS
ncbi:MAG: ABC transporter substrate-binding protein [Proteobacteria bacterium]|nr:ABC transporter substrate-binding protein [Pseudomonadota bacterium]